MKKFFAVATATVMTLAMSVSVFAATPVVSYNFDDTTGMTKKGAADFVANPDDAADKVLCVETGAGGMNGNYVSVDPAVLKDADFSNGFTISMNVRPTANASDWNYLFAVGTNGATEDTTDTEVWKYLDGTIGFIQRKDGGASDYVGYFPGDGWVEGNAMGGVANGENPYNYFCLEENANKWYKLTYVYATDYVAIYVDGVLTQKHAATGMDAALAAVSTGNSFNLGCGIDPNLENCGGYIDDVVVYAAALTDAEVKAIPAEVVAESDDAPAGDTPAGDKPADSTPKTGDMTAVLPVALLAVAAMAVVVVMRKRTVTE